MSGTVMSFDVGSKRIGIAVSDRLRIASRPLTTLERDGNELSIIRDLISQVEGSLLVVGLPQRLDGGRSDSTVLAEAFAAALKETTGREVRLVEERLSSKEAERLMAEVGVPVNQRRNRRDEFAAAVILQWFLEECRGSA